MQMISNKQDTQRSSGRIKIKKINDTKGMSKNVTAAKNDQAAPSSAAGPRLSRIGSIK